MTERIEKMLVFLRSGKYKAEREHYEFQKEDTDASVGTIERFTEIVSAEKPWLFEDDLFGFHRFTDFRIPEWQGNITPNYKKVIASGFDEIKKK